MAQRSDVQADQELKEARKLRELFKGRFSDEDALELLKEHGGLSAAVDFVLNGEPAEVRKLINDRNKALVPILRRDSEYVNTALREGVEASVRLFACGDCDRYWWRKVPSRKEVSKCRICKVKYDPVPRDQEWGLGEFLCVCGNIFFGSAWMNHTKSPCYKYECGLHVSPSRILPPNRSPRHVGDFRTRHSFYYGSNIDNRAERSTEGDETGRRLKRSTPLASVSINIQSRDKDGPICPHERSVTTRRVLYPSSVHTSTGSTVNTFMSQGELAEDYEEPLRMEQVLEVDEY